MKGAKNLLSSRRKQKQSVPLALDPSDQRQGSLPCEGGKGTAAFGPTV